MAFPPVLHGTIESVRFGRVLFAEIAPGDGGPCRYCVALGARPPRRARFSDPGAAVRALLAPLERGASVDGVVLGGPGDPLRHAAAGAILRGLRARAHLGATVLTDGVLLQDRDARRDASEAGLVVAWLPPPEGPDGAAAFERHLEGVASLRRESRVSIALEIPVRPGVDDAADAIERWRAAARRVRPQRVFVVPAPGGRGEDAAAALERVRAAIHPRAGAFLDDGTLADRRCFADAGS